MAHYYYLDSNGADANLQLYSLKQAMRYWEELERDVTSYSDDVSDIKERCVFVLASLGLSVSQLLGQNNPNPKDSVPFPIELVSTFVEKHGLDPKIKKDFEQFNYFYNGCRHFGLTTGVKGYDRIDQLTMPVAKGAMSLGYISGRQLYLCSVETPTVILTNSTWNKLSVIDNKPTKTDTINSELVSHGCTIFLAGYATLMRRLLER